MIRMRCHYPERPVNDLGLSLWGLGIHERISRKRIHRPRGIGCYLVLYFYDPVDYQCVASRRRCPAGTFLVIKPDEPHQFGSLDRAWDHSWLLVGGTCVRRFLRENKIPLNTPVEVPVAPFFEQALFQMHREVGRHLKPQATYLKNILHNLFIDISREMANADRPPAVPGVFMDARAFIQSRFTEDLTLEQMARRAHLSIPRFATRFKECFGIAPIELQISLRMERACFLLSDANLRIGEIAHAVGYSNVHYFSRLFRKRFGIPASRMRPRRPLNKPTFKGRSGSAK